MSRIQELKNELKKALRDEMTRVSASIVIAEEHLSKIVAKEKSRMDSRERELYRAQVAVERLERLFTWAKLDLADAQRRLEEEKNGLPRLLQQEKLQTHIAKRDALQQELKEMGDTEPIHLRDDAPSKYQKLDLIRNVLKEKSLKDNYDDETLFHMYDNWIKPVEKDDSKLLALFETTGGTSRYHRMKAFVEQNMDAFQSIMPVKALDPTTHEMEAKIRAEMEDKIRTEMEAKIRAEMEAEIRAEMDTSHAKKPKMVWNIPDDGNAHPWTFNTMNYVATHDGCVWLYDKENEDIGKWVGMVDFKKGIIDTTIKEPEFED